METFLPVVVSDIENGPESSKHAMSIVAALLFRAFSRQAVIRLLL